MMFTDTRYRTSDPISSRLAAKTAAGGRAGEIRRQIEHYLLMHPEGATARHISNALGIEYFACQRRISECANIYKTGMMLSEGMVWAHR